MHEGKKDRRSRDRCEEPANSVDPSTRVEWKAFASEDVTECGLEAV